MTVKKFIEYISTACTLNGLDMDQLEMTIMIDGNRVAYIRDLEFFNEELALYVD